MERVPRTLHSQVVVTECWQATSVRPNGVRRLLVRRVDGTSGPRRFIRTRDRRESRVRL
jgi:hypothetical protein